MGTDTSELRPYLDASWQLIPLHSHDYFDEHKGKKRERGKSPLHSNWTRRPYKSEDQVKHLEKGSNVGVRLRATDLVIDVDPRNFAEGDDPFARLCKDCGLDPNLYPTVETGSGGLHVYMTKPGDISVRDSLQDYEGVEFKTLGRQVVSAGSTHPTTKRTYTWDFLRPVLDKVARAPDRLLNIIRRPSRSLSTGGGEHSQEELAVMLDALDPEDFSQQDEWFTLMQACHHATAGDGRAEFIEWSTRDPEYSDHGGLIGRRWDSLHADNDGGNRVTYRTLHKLLIDHDAEAVIPRKPAADDFEDLTPEDMPDGMMEEHEKRGPLEKMNDRYWAVMEGNQFKVFWETTDDETAIYRVDHTIGEEILAVPARKRWMRVKKYDFKDMLAGHRVQHGEKTIELADAWLTWPGRRKAEGVVFDPERDHENRLNLWTGWGVEPRKDAGSWARLDELLFEVLADGDDAVYKYTLDWAAHMVQHPGRMAEVAVCFQGGKGVGKGTWGRVLAQIAGKHGMQVTSSDQLTGRFNDHLRDVVLLFADEALKPYDKDGESRLKGIITEPWLAYEGKGKDIVSARNRIHIVMASNEDWFVPAGLDGERRFMVQLANTKRVGQHGWFQKLHDELDDGGLQALMWDLMHRDIAGWAPREGIPSTNAFIEQKLSNMAPVPQWWFNILLDGRLPVETTREDTDWREEPVRVFKQDLRENFRSFCRENGIRSSGGMGRSNDILFVKGLKAIMPALKNNMQDPVPDDRIWEIKPAADGRAICVELPDLAQCRTDMEKLLGTEDYKWPSVQ